MATEHEINDETDARFWAQVHVKVKHQLDPSNPADRHWIAVWQDINHKVRAEAKRGTPVLSHKDPVVAQQLEHAKHATNAAVAHLEAAAIAENARESRRHVDAAAEASMVASAAAFFAASRQPPTVSPIIVIAAARSAARSVPGWRPQPSLLEYLPMTHPAISSPAAQPMLPPDAFHPEVMAPMATPPPPPPTTPAEHLAIAQATAAPEVAVAVHEAAAQAAPPVAPPALPAPPAHPASTALAVHGRNDEETRAIASALAVQTAGKFTGVVLTADGWDAQPFDTRAAAGDWFAAAADARASFRYVAYFDRTDTSSWPHAVEEMFGLGGPLEMGGHHSFWKWPAIAVGALAATGLTIMAVKRRGTRKGRA